MESRQLELTRDLSTSQHKVLQDGRFVKVGLRESNKHALTIVLSELRFNEEKNVWEKEMTDIAEKVEVGSVVSIAINHSYAFDSLKDENVQTFNRVMDLLLKHAATIKHFSFEELMFFDLKETEITEYLTKYLLPLSELESIEFVLRTKYKNSKKRQFQSLYQLVGFLAESHSNLNAFQKLRSLNFGIGNELYSLEEMQRFIDSLLTLQNLETISFLIEVEGLVQQEIPLLCNGISRLSNLKRISVQVKDQKTEKLFKEEDVIKMIRPFASITKQIEEFSWNMPCLFQSEDNLAFLSEMIGSLVNARFINVLTTQMKCPAGNTFLPFLRGLKKLERLSINLSKCDLQSEKDFLEITECQKLQLLHIEVTTIKDEDVKCLCDMLLTLKESLKDIKIKFHSRLKYREVCLLGETLIQLNRTKSRPLEITQPNRLNNNFQGFSHRVNSSHKRIDSIMQIVSGRTYPIFVSNQIQQLVSLMKISYLDLNSQGGEENLIQEQYQQHVQKDFRYEDIQSEIKDKFCELQEMPSVIRSIISYPICDEKFFNVPILALIRWNCDHLLKITLKEVDVTLSRELVEALKLCSSLQAVQLIFQVNKQTYVDSVLSSSKNLQRIQIQGKLQGIDQGCSVRSEQVFQLPYLTNLNIEKDQSSNLLKQYVQEKSQLVAELFIYEKLIQPHLSFQKKYSHFDLHY